MDWKLELMVLPVSDVDRAKDFYADKLGFNVDVDHTAGDAFRVVQLTPPGSACSVSVGRGITEAAPGSVQGMHLVVADIDKARSLLVERGVDASEIFGTDSWLVAVQAHNLTEPKFGGRKGSGQLLLVRGPRAPQPGAAKKAPAKGAGK